MPGACSVSARRRAEDAHVANAGRSLTCPKGGSLDGYALCQSYHVLIFLEIKSLPRRHLLLRFFGRYGRSQESLQAVRKRSRRDARLSASAPPPRTSLGIRCRARTLLCFCVLCCEGRHLSRLATVARQKVTPVLRRCARKDYNLHYSRRLCADNRAPLRHAQRSLASGVSVSIWRV